MEPQLWATDPCTAHEVPVALSPSVMIVWVREATAAVIQAPVVPTETTNSCCHDVTAWHHRL